MFLLNSCLGQFSAACSRRHPFSRSYGAILPSSLTMLLPPALGFSPHPPVSVYGTGLHGTIAAFLDGRSAGFPTFFSVRIATSRCVADLPSAPVPRLLRAPCPDPVSPPCPHSSVHTGYRNFNLLSIGYDSRPRLRPRLSQGRSALPWKPWIFGLKDSHLYLATHSGILSSRKSTVPSGTASSLRQCSSTSGFPLHGFGVVFQPRTFSARDLSTSELLRTL